MLSPIFTHSSSHSHFKYGKHLPLSGMSRTMLRPLLVI
jgi:hypothetical protein